MLLLSVSFVGSMMAVAPPTALAAPITTEDFQSGTFANWTGTTRLTIDNAIGSPSAPSARAQVTSQSAFAYRDLGTSYNQICASLNVNLASGSGVDLFRLRTAANGAVIKAFVAANGTLQLRSDFSGVTRTTTTALGAGWHNVELCGTVGAATTWDLYRDGVNIVNAWSANTGTTGVGRIQIGDTAAKTFTANFDHIVVDQAPGDEAPPADTTAPTVPGTPTGTSPSTTSIQISWAASTDVSLPITYRVYRDGDPTSIGSTQTTSYTDTGLTSGSSHTYTVDAVDTATNASAQSAASDAIVVMLPDTDAPTVPGTPTGTSPSTTSIQISWAASTDVSLPITYRVYRDGDPTSIGSTQTTSYTDTNLTPGSSHTYTVDAVDAATNASAQSAASDAIVVMLPDTTAPTVPGKPTGISPTPSSIQISWAASTDPSLPITYRVYRDGDPTSIGSTQTTSFTDTGLVATSSHTYTVDAVDAATNASAQSAASDAIVVLAIPDTTAPTVPGRPAGSSSTANTIQISWAASTDASLPITYRVYRDGGATSVGSTTGTSFLDTLLVAGSSHTYTVDAVDAATNASAKSQASLTITVQAAPAAGLQPVPGHTGLAYDQVRTDTPRITTGEITDIAYFGNRVFIAGTFSSIRNNTSTNTTTVNQAGLASYNIDTGLIDTTFRPTFGGGGVREVELSPDGTKLFVVGTFNTVNGVTKRKVASLNPTTGATITTFTADANGAATAVEASNTTVYIGGQFTTINGASKVGLTAVSATTGANIAGFNNSISGGIGVNGALTVQALKLTHDGTKLLVVHTGRQIAGQDRYGIGLISTQTNQLLPWRTRLWDDNLQYVGGITRIYAGDIAPNDQYFVVSSGSGGDRPPISDTAVAYPIAGDDNVQPLWISRLFDSVYSVAISETAVYLGGHYNYTESPTAPDPWPGLDNVGYGRGQGLAGYGLGDAIVIRDHIGAVDPATGKALEWNPGSNSFEGNKAMLVTPRGVFAGGDATTQGGQNVGRVAFYDFNRVPAVGANETKIVSPIEGRVEPSDTQFFIEGTATATSGVQRVQLEVRERDTGRYLQDDLVTWGSANTINVNLASPNATSTTWSLPLTIAGNHRIQFLAKTYGVNGSSDSSKAIKTIETFGVTDQTPTTSVTGPSGSIIPTTTFTVTGTATDDIGVNSITFSFRDAQNRYLQDDGSTASTYNTFRGTPDVIGATSATWSYEVTVPYEGEWTMQAIAVDTIGQSDLRSADATWIVSDTAIAPTVTITAPATMIPPTAAPTLTLAPGGPLTFTGTATDDEGLNYVTITLRNTATQQVLAADGTWGTNVIAGSHRISPASSLPGTTYNWSYTTPFDLTPGTYTFSVAAADDLGLTTSSANQGRLTINVQVPGDAFPDTSITPTGTVNGVQVLHLDLTGGATDDLGVAAVRVTVRDQDSGLYLQPNGTLAAAYTLLDATLASPGATITTWTLPVNLPVQGNYGVTAIAFDTANQQDPSTTGATARYPIYPGDLPPTVTEALFQPAEGTVYTDGRIFVSGRLEDDQQIAQAQVAIRNGLGQYMSSSGTFTSTTASYRTAFLNSPGSPGSNFSYTTPTIPNGSYTVLARGVDQHGFVTPIPSQRTVTVTGTTINLPPVADFTYSCVQNVCTFDGRTSTDEVTPTLTYSWNFGSGSGSGAVPVKTYTAANTYTVTLTVRDENGLSGVTAKTVTITEPAGNLAPTPVFNTPSCAARVCNISGVGSTDPNLGDTFTYLWNFGDGTATSTTSASAHTFAVDGTYTVSLTVTDGWLKAATTTRVITIAEPASNVPPIPVISTPNCAARACTFFGVASSDPNGDTFTYLWNFGDNTATSTASSPAHTFAVDGSYTVTLTVTDAWGDLASTTRVVTIAKPATNVAPVPVINAPSCVARVCNLSSAGTADANGDAFTYLWNFGDASATSTSSAPAHTFPALTTYTVTLTVTDAWGDAASTTRAVSFTEPPTNVPPVPAIDPQICAARACTFSAVSSTDPDGDTFTYSWNWGDNTAVSTSSTPTHTYAVDGTYTVTLTLTDVWGKAASTTRSVTIAKPASNVPPIPVISTPTCAARACTLYGISSSDPNGDTFTYLWNFGDNTATSTAVSPAHTYAVDGSYTVTLTVTDWWGDAASTTRVVTIAKPGTNVAPVPVINAPTCVARVCTMSATGSADPNGDTFTYLWNFGDATATSTSAAPVHTYLVDGSYTVTLTLTDAWGDAASTTRVVTITKPGTNVAPTAVIAVPSCAGRVCNFSSSGTSDPNGDNMTYLWNFGDATATSTSAAPGHTFAVAGTYTVTLTVTDAWGDAGSTTSVVTVA